MSAQDPGRGPLGNPPGCNGRVLGRARNRRNDPKDFVCFCQGISRQEIVQAIDLGASSLEDIQNDLGATVGPCGGSCTPNVVKLLNDTLQKRAPKAATAAAAPAEPPCSDACPPPPAPAERK